MEEILARKKKARKKTIESNKYKGKTRKNNPSSGLVDQKTEPLGKIERKTYSYDPHLDPSLNWAGKAEGNSFEVQSVSLHTHEKIEPREIIKSFLSEEKEDHKQLPLFSEELKRIKDKAVEFYQHENKWSNRMIAGDSLLVMNSLLTKENMGGKVQCVYIDPPYGIKYGSNFQPFTNKRDVKDGKDGDLTAEPEMLKAFRDTWELGIHSYLTYMRDRLLLAKELLNESGSCFVQISDENVHLIRNLMDEVFGTKNFITIITFRKAGNSASNYMQNICDYILCYGKNKKETKWKHLFQDRLYKSSLPKGYDLQEDDSGSYFRIKNENKNYDYYNRNRKSIFQSVSMESLGYSKTGSQEIVIEDKKFKPRSNAHWKTTSEGIQKLYKKNRIIISGNSIRYKMKLDDFPVIKITNIWSDVMGASNMKYVVQTNETVIQRCLLMTTDPGDIVFDPTCGSGTTAYVAEQWGRRWITCDTSRVALTLAKQRLMTATFDYYQLENPDEGVGSGFQYKKVPHITLGSIANNESAPEEILYDQPLIDNSRIRVTSPFTMEAVPGHSVETMKQENERNYKYEWLDEVKKSGVRGKKGITTDMEFARLETMKGTQFLHAEGVTTNPRKVVFSFGSEHAPLDKRQVEVALQEVASLPHDQKPDILVFAAFQFDPEASRVIGESGTDGMKTVEVQMNMDLQTHDLKKKSSSDNSFWLLGQPDVKLKKEKQKKFTVEVRGWDYYDPASGSIESGGSDKIAMWVLDTDYNGRAIHPKQVFFPMGKEKDGWGKLKKTLKAEIDEGKIEHFRGTKSFPFEAGKGRKVAIKIVDDRGIESLKVIDLKAA